MSVLFLPKRGRGLLGAGGSSPVPLSVEGVSCGAMGLLDLLIPTSCCVWSLGARVARPDDSAVYCWASRAGSLSLSFLPSWLEGMTKNSRGTRSKVDVRAKKRA